jgi:hypothetical protein
VAASRTHEAIVIARAGGEKLPVLDYKTMISAANRDAA